MSDLELVTVSVSVPKQHVATLMHYAATLIDGSDPADDELDAEEIGIASTRLPWGWGAAAVRRAYHGGVSEYWRPFLEALAEQAGEWVDWEQLLDAVGLDARQAAGMLGAAERRCKGRPPYEKQVRGGVRQFRMDPRVAAVIIELRDQRG